jgi:hypothetical protein
VRSAAGDVDREPPTLGVKPCGEVPNQPGERARLRGGELFDVERDAGVAVGCGLARDRRDSVAADAGADDQARGTKLGVDDWPELSACGGSQRDNRFMRRAGERAAR